MIDWWPVIGYGLLGALGGLLIAGAFLSVFYLLTRRW